MSVPKEIVAPNIRWNAATTAGSKWVPAQRRSGLARKLMSAVPNVGELSHETHEGGGGVKSVAQILKGKLKPPSCLKGTAGCKHGA